MWLVLKDAWAVSLCCCLVVLTPLALSQAWLDKSHTSFLFASDWVSLSSRAPLQTFYFFSSLFSPLFNEFPLFYGALCRGCFWQCFCVRVLCKEAGCKKQRWLHRPRSAIPELGRAHSAELRGGSTPSAQVQSHLCRDVAVAFLSKGHTKPGRFLECRAGDGGCCHCVHCLQPHRQHGGDAVSTC